MVSTINKRDFELKDIVVHTQHNTQNKYPNVLMEDTPFLSKKSYSKDYQVRSYKSNHYEIRLKGQELITFDEDVLLSILNRPSFLATKGITTFKVYTITQSEIRKLLNLPKNATTNTKIINSIKKMKEISMDILKDGVEKYSGGIIEKIYYDSLDTKSNLKDNNQTKQYYITIDEEFLDLFYGETSIVSILDINKRYSLNYYETKSLFRYLSQHKNFFTGKIVKESIYNLFKKTKIDIKCIDKNEYKIRKRLIIKDIEKWNEDLKLIGIVLTHRSIKKTDNELGEYWDIIVYRQRTEEYLSSISTKKIKEGK